MSDRRKLPCGIPELAAWRPGEKTNLTAEKQSDDLDRAARGVGDLLACQNATSVIPGGPFDGQRLRLATLTNERALSQTRGHVDSAPSLNLVM